MTLPETIQKAYQGGYKRGVYLLNGKVDQDDYWFLLDPLWWQSLGKAMGWTTVELEMEDGAEFFDDRYHDFMGGKLSYGYYEGACMVFTCEEWKYKQHQFITHIQECKSIESFFLLFEP